MANRIPSILKIVPSPPVVRVVDIGANPIEGDPNYQPLLAAGVARVVGFEPIPEALASLKEKAGPHEMYLPHALGDGGEHELHVCRASGFSSFLQGNAKLLDYFHAFDTWSQVQRTIKLATTRLDDIHAIDDVDLLKVDVEGYELEILKHGLSKLAMATIAQVEVNFVPMHLGQPLFAEIDQFMRAQGLVIHKFSNINSRVFRPLVVNNNAYQGLSQILWTDAIFVRDFTRFDELPAEKLLRTAIILHEVYNSPDLANVALMAHDRKTGGHLSERYLAEVLNAADAPG
jgi:FkbM family methyltransferase